jgi:hypothetical protein
MNMLTRDRRRECRYPTQIACSYSLVDHPGRSEQPGTILDVATNGLLIDIGHSLPRGTRLTIRAGDSVICARVMRSVMRLTGWLSIRYYVGVQTIGPLSQEMFQYLAYPDASFSVRVSDDYLDNYFRTQFR